MERHLVSQPDRSTAGKFFRTKQGKLSRSVPSGKRCELFPQRQREAERRALAGLAALGPDAAAVVLDDLLADREAEPGAMGLAVRGERLEERLRDLGRDAAAGVLDLRAQLAVFDREAEKDLPAVGQLL